ncbi:UNVERIFIED_CONTAM: hypothetical protein NCL1_35951 [Trichonephila clavipes]
MSLHLTQPLIDVPGSGGKGPPMGRWGSLAIIELFHGYDASHVVSRLPLFLPTRYAVVMVTIRGIGGQTTSVRFFTVTQKWANFSFTLERKKVSLQKYGNITHFVHNPNLVFHRYEYQTTNPACVQYRSEP